MELVFNSIINCLFFIIDSGFLIVDFLTHINGKISYKDLKINFKPFLINIYI